MNLLTDKQSLVLEYIAERITGGLPPTYREISERFGWHSMNAVARHTEALERKGYIEREANKARHIRITQQGHDYLRGREVRAQ